MPVLPFKMISSQTLRQMLGLLVLLGIACNTWAFGCKYSKEINLSRAAADYGVVEMKALAGRLDVIGAETSKISIEGDVCSDEQYYVDQMDIIVEETASSLILTAIIPYDNDDWHAQYAHIDITVTLPHALLIQLRDSSGDISVTDASVIFIDDSSGAIRINDNLAALELNDSSGDIDIRGSKGTLTISDSSGKIDIRDVDGDVLIPRDSSGDMEIDTVNGSVTIERDGSGGINIENVQRTVSIDSDGSGDIEIDNIEGSVEIGSDGSGKISVSRIAGNFTVLSKGSGDIRSREVKGNTDIPITKS
ncbi:MAG: hypothetical protein P8N51_10245 [Pseudomonadales bacterium]|nr:hypothetical protein [Pseudomonadales bacterium]